MATNDKFHRDPRVIAARRQYLLDLRAGIAEKQAWAKADAVYSAVREELRNQPSQPEDLGQ